MGEIRYDLNFFVTSWLLMCLVQADPKINDPN